MLIKRCDRFVTRSFFSVLPFSREVGSRTKKLCEPSVLGRLSGASSATPGFTPGAPICRRSAARWRRMIVETSPLRVYGSPLEAIKKDGLNFSAKIFDIGSLAVGREANHEGAERS